MYWQNLHLIDGERLKRPQTTPDIEREDDDDDDQELAICRQDTMKNLKRNTSIDIDRIYRGL